MFKFNSSRTALALLLVLMFSLPGCARKHLYSGRVADDTGKSVDGAEVRLEWDAHTPGFWGTLTMEGFDPRRTRDLRDLTLMTDADGRFTFRATGNYISATIQKPKYYGAWAAFHPDEPNAQSEIPIPLPRILRPQPMVGKKVNLRLPVGSSRLQYDFLAGDCLPPLGNGAVADLEIEWTRPVKMGAEASRRAFKSHVLGAGNGVVYIPSPEQRSSGPKRLRSLHQAPLEGYTPDIDFGNHIPGGKLVAYLKIRAGQPNGPLYGKMLDPLLYWAAKSEDEFEFEYVINPSGDRGLEIDVNRITVPSRHALEYAPEEF